MAKLNAQTAVQATVSRFLWLIVLIPILAISGYSLYYVQRHLGSPRWIAVGTSVCFDGVALLMAEKSLEYVRLGMSGARPRFWVLVFSGLGAYLQTWHGQLAGEPPGLWALWAALPIGAAVVYDVHLHGERRKALIKARLAYPAFGLTYWALFPFASCRVFRSIVKKRAESLARYEILTLEASERKATESVPNNSEVAAEQEEIRQINAGRKARKPAANSHAPVRHIREWAKANGHDVPGGGRLPKRILEAYDQANGSP